MKSYLMSRNKTPTINAQHVKGIINRFIQNIRKKYNMGLFKDITLIDETNPSKLNF